MSNEFDGVVWPGWEVVRLIGRGSFGAVYEISREVGCTTEKAALKVITIPQNKEAEIQALRYDGYDNESITQYFKDSCVQFENEYAMMADMKGHSNIVYCEDLRRIQHDDGLGWDIYIKMELLTPLKSYLQDKPAPEQAVRLGIDLCKALEECQRLHIVHRDIKPGNIFVGRDGTYKLGDFGIARTMEATMGGTKVGTYEYMAPEVYNNQPYGTAADIYSVGLVLYWMLNDHAGPFIQPRAPLSQRENARTRRLSGEPLPAPRNGSEALKAIVLKACAYDIKERYHDPEEMRADLEALLKGAAVPINAPTNASVREDKPASLEERKARMTETYGESTVGAGYAPIPQPAPEPAPAPEPVEEESTVGAGYVSIPQPAPQPAPAPEPVEEESTVGAGYAYRSAPVPEPAPAPEPVEEETTVGAGYASKPPKAPEKKPDNPPAVLEKEKKKKKSPWGWIGAAAAVILILLLLPRACAGELGVPAVSTASNTTAAPTKAPALQKDWTEWLDKLPRDVSEEEYEIEETTMYSYRTKETSSSTTSKHMEGWKYEGTATAGKDYGDWSNWNTGSVAASDNREIETKKQYRYQDMEYATGSSGSMSGWELYDTTYTLGDYGSWSDWTTTQLSSSGNTQVDTMTQYRYRYIEYTNCSNSWASGWDFYSGPHYGSWGSSQTTTSKPAESDTLRITNTKQTKWGYYHYCCNYYNGCYNADSISYGSGSHQYHSTTSGWAFPTCNVGDKGGKQAYGGTGSGCGGCSAGFYIWFRNTGADAYEYTYQTRSVYYTLSRWKAWSSWGSNYSSDADQVESRTLYRSRTRQSIPTYHFRRWGNWTDWSDVAVSSSSTRNVKNRTLYRYRDRVEKKTYLFSRWTEWSEYTQAPAEEDEYTEVVTKTMYRYRSKNKD